MSNYLKQALIILDETNATAANTIDTLEQQNKQIKDMRSKMKTMDETLSLSTRLMRQISRFC